ncbi:MAG: YdeI/OmpD-associated family protein [Alphaproteobacteria bacterium]|nr:YdeI/OmpD-associated family protein [Alphaproteobacteria bacterium]
MVRGDGVDAFFGRAKLWGEELAALREVLLGAGLAEELKWGKPCYCAEGKNIAILQPMKEQLALMFFKGALLDDPAQVLEEQGPNSRSARRVVFRSVGDVEERAPVVEALVRRAIEVERAGLSVEAPAELALVEELEQWLGHDPAHRVAFEALTPGRQREYHLHVSGAKQAATRQRRVEQVAPRILAGKGLRD